MTDRKKKSPKDHKHETLSTHLGGLLAFEFYEARGYVVSVRVSADKVFFIDLMLLNKLVEEFNEAVEIRGGFPLIQKEQNGTNKHPK